MISELILEDNFFTDANIKKFKHSLPGFLVSLIIDNKSPILLEEMITLTIPKIKYLRKTDGSTYSDNVKKSIIGTLKNTKIFIKDGNLYDFNREKAKAFLLNQKTHKKTKGMKNFILQSDFEDYDLSKSIEKEVINKVKEIECDSETSFKERKRKNIKFFEKDSIRFFSRKYFLNKFKVFEEIYFNLKQSSDSNLQKSLELNIQTIKTVKDFIDLIGDEKKFLGFMICFNFFYPLLKNYFMKFKNKREDNILNLFGQIEDLKKKIERIELNNKMMTNLDELTSQNNINFIKRNSYETQENFFPNEIQFTPKVFYNAFNKEELRRRFLSNNSNNSKNSVPNNDKTMTQSTNNCQVFKILNKKRKNPNINESNDKNILNLSNNLIDKQIKFENGKDNEKDFKEYSNLSYIQSGTSINDRKLSRTDSKLEIPYYNYNSILMEKMKRFNSFNSNSYLSTKHIKDDDCRGQSQRKNKVKKFFISEFDRYNRKMSTFFIDANEEPTENNYN